MDDLDLGRTMVELVPTPTASAHMALAERNQRIIDATDADGECPHGRLPGDRHQTCDCWGLRQERAA